MAVIPNPCLDACQFGINTETGLTFLRLAPGGGLECDPEAGGIKVVPSDDAAYSSHSNDFHGSYALPAPLSTGILAPSVGLLAPVFAVAGIDPVTAPWDLAWTVWAGGDLVTIPNVPDHAGHSTVYLEASIDGGSNWERIHSWIAHATADVGATPSSAMPWNWHISEGYAIEPLFRVGYEVNSGDGAAYVQGTLIRAAVQIHRINS